MFNTHTFQTTSGKAWSMIVTWNPYNYGLSYLIGLLISIWTKNSVHTQSKFLLAITIALPYLWKFSWKFWTCLGLPTVAKLCVQIQLESDSTSRAEIFWSRCQNFDFLLILQRFIHSLPFLCLVLFQILTQSRLFSLIFLHYHWLPWSGQSSVIQL